MKIAIFCQVLETVLLMVLIYDFESSNTKKFKAENLQNQQNVFVKEREDVKVQSLNQDTFDDEDDSVPSYLRGFNDK